MKKNQLLSSEESTSYRSLVRPALMDVLQEKIMDYIVVRKKYKEKNYTARQLAKDLGTNSRYISAVVNTKFRMNYTALVNKYRIGEALQILSDPQYSSLSIEKVAGMVGFINRQSFYSVFRKQMNMTPVQYRKQQLESLNDNDGNLSQKITA